MCGIAGYRSETPFEVEKGRRVGMLMAKAMHSRGPDYQDVWTNEKDAITLAHARLSVIDLSEAANQPFISDDGRYALVYNGEIYNFQSLRDELRREGYIFRTASDTEVLLHACDHWGVVQATKKLIGMFAFGLWDSRKKTLVLGRDPLGIKPLYYGKQANVFMFASTLGAIRQHPEFVDKIASAGLAAYFRYSYVPAPLSIYEGISKLLPGHLLFVDQEGQQKIEQYWDTLEVARAGISTSFVGSDVEIINSFEMLARDAVQRCMVSDVPLGAFLSGGIDSSLVVALMQSGSRDKVRTFTVGFDDSRFDESEYARRVAQHLGCEHSEIKFSAKEAEELIPQLPDCYDEPFADSSQIPTLLLSRFARRSVTVVLSGDGGDELFAGYDRYYWADRLQRMIGWHGGRFQKWMHKFPILLPRTLLLAALNSVPGGNRLIPSVDGWYHLLRLLGHSEDFKYFYLTTPMTVCAYRDTPVLRSECEPKSILDDERIRQLIPNLIQWMQFIDQSSYLPDDILQKVDRASMAYSLEARVPLLDHRLVEFAWRVPAHLKLRNGRGKIIMRELLARFIPRELIERPKRGFSIPLSGWLKRELREWAESLIESPAAHEDSLLMHEGVRATWDNFLTGQAEHTLTTVWNLLVYLQWRNRQRDRQPCAEPFSMLKVPLRSSAAGANS